ncbi:MAG: DarP family protein [Desulfobulbaceae bacterium]
MEISKSEQKRRMKMLEEMVAEICSLPSVLTKQLPLSGEIRELLKQAAALKGGARNRQVKYITKLLKDEPVNEVYDFLVKRKGTSLQEKKAFHELEYLRDALLTEAIEQQREAEANQEDFGEEWQSRVVEEIVRTLPRIDGRAMASLAWMYARGRNPRYSREIFRQLRAAQEQQKREDAREKS